MTYQECYREGQTALVQAGIEEAALDARLLLEYVCGTNRNDLLVHGEQPVAQDKYRSFLALIEKREKRIPLQHLTGTQDFMGLIFQVNEHVLIPRQDTEILVEEVLKNLHDGMSVLDMCTGSGCILISLLHYSNACSGVGADVSEEALRMAIKNAEKLLPGHCIVSGKNTTAGPGMPKDRNKTAAKEQKAEAGTVQFVQSDLFAEVSGVFDIIVSNPPYIPTSVIDTLMPEVREHEPRRALDGAEDGLHFYRKIIRESRRYLLQGGMLFLEIGYDQAEAVSALMQDAGYKEVRVVKDYAGLDRVVYGTC